jgi:hypothetical protein
LQTSELRPGGEGEINILASAAGAEIHDGGLDGVAVVVDLDLLSAPGVGSSTSHNVVGGLAPGGRGKGNDHVSVMKLGTAGAEATVVVVDGHVNVLVGLATGAGISGGRGRRGGSRRSISGRSVSRSGGGSGGSGWLGSRCLVGWLGRLRGCGRRSFSYRLGLLDDRSGSRVGRGSGRRDRRRRGSGGGLWRNRRNGGLLGSRSLGSGSGLGHSAGGSLGLLVEVASGRGGGLGDGLVFPDGGVDNHGLGNDLGLVGERAPVERSSNGERAEEQGREDSGSLHFGVCSGIVCWIAMLDDAGIADLGGLQRVNEPASSSVSDMVAVMRRDCDVG